MAVIGTDATNEVRFEPNLTGKFLRVAMGHITGAGATLAVMTSRG